MPVRCTRTCERILETLPAFASYVRFVQEENVIFMTVGSTRNDFSRLLREADRLAGLGLLPDLYGQIGLSDYRPEHFGFSRFLSMPEFLDRLRSARFVISHGGTGTLETCLGLGKKVILVPRRAEFGEHPDNHQLELAEYLASRNRVLFVDDIARLGQAVARIESWQPSFKIPTGGAPVFDEVRTFIEQAFTGGRARVSAYRHTARPDTARAHDAPPAS
jgi:UDP-N-acetylglucosamine transferase subunit ALG13